MEGLKKIRELSPKSPIYLAEIIILDRRDGK